MGDSVVEKMNAMDEENVDVLNTQENAFHEATSMEIVDIPVARDTEGEARSGIATFMAIANDLKARDCTSGDRNLDTFSSNQKYFRNGYFDIFANDSDRHLQTQIENVAQCRKRICSAIVEYKKRIANMEIDSTINLRSRPINDGLKKLNLDSELTDPNAVRIRLNESTKQFSSEIEKVREKLAVMKELLKNENIQELSNDVYAIEKAIDSMSVSVSDTGCNFDENTTQFQL